MSDHDEIRAAICKICDGLRWTNDRCPTHGQFRCYYCLGVPWQTTRSGSNALTMDTLAMQRLVYEKRRCKCIVPSDADYLPQKSENLPQK